MKTKNNSDAKPKVSRTKKVFKANPCCEPKVDLAPPDFQKMLLTLGLNRELKDDEVFEVKDIEQKGKIAEYYNDSIFWNDIMLSLNNGVLKAISKVIFSSRRNRLWTEIFRCYPELKEASFNWILSSGCSGKLVLKKDYGD